MRLVSLPIITTSSSTQPAALGTSPPGPVKPDSSGDKASAMAKRVSLLAGKGAINFEKLKVAMNQVNPKLAAGDMAAISKAGSLTAGSTSSQIFTLQQLGALSRAAPNSTQTLLSGLNFDIQQGKSKDVKGNVGGVLESILGKGAGSKSNSQHAFIQALNSTKTQPLKQPRKLSGSKSPVYSKKPETKSSISTIQLISTTQLKGQTLANPAKMVKTSPALSQPTTTTTTISTLPAKNPLIPSEGSVQTIQKLQPTEVSVQTIQKLQFHDFPLTTVSLKTSRGVSTYTQAKILTDLQHGSGLTLNLLEDGKVKKVGAAAQPTLRANTTLHTVPMPRSSVSPPAPGSNVLTSPKADVSVGSVTVVSKGPISTPGPITTSAPTANTKGLMSTSAVTIPVKEVKPVAPKLAVEIPKQEQTVASICPSTPSTASTSQAGGSQAMDVSDDTQLPTVSAVLSTRTRKVRAPKQLSDYTELI